MGAGKQKLEGIQIARAIAALSVCYFHSWTTLDRFPSGTSFPIPGLAKYGWLGADLFFGISGFVICLVVTKPNFHAGQFLIRRAFRIYPLWLATLSLFAVMAWAWRGLLPTETLGNFLYSATLLPTQGFPFYDIGWSLQHEVAFYLLALALVSIAGVAGLTAFLCASIAAYHLLPMPWCLSQLTSYHGDFLAGVLAFTVAPHLRKFGPVIPMIAGASILAGILADAGPSGLRWLYLAPLFLIMVGFANVTHGATWIVVFGDASYSIYLIHPLLFTTAKSLTKLVGADILWIEEPLRFVSIAAVIGLSLLSWRLFEKPMIEAGESLAATVDNQGHNRIAGEPPSLPTERLQLLVGSGEKLSPYNAITELGRSTRNAECPRHPPCRGIH